MHSLITFDFLRRRGLGWCSLAALALVLGAGAVSGQTPIATLGQGPTIQQLEGRLAAMAAREDIDAATKAQIDAAYKRAIEELNRARQFRIESDAVRKATAAAPAEIVRIERGLGAAALEQTRTAGPSAANGLKSEDIAQRLVDARLARENAQQALAGLEHALSDIGDRSVAARRQRANARASLERLAAERSGMAGVGSALAEARAALLAARAESLRAELEWIDREAAYQPALARLTQLKRDIAQAELAKANAELDTWRGISVTRQREAVEAARAEAARADASLAGRPALLRSLAADNAELKAQFAELNVALDQALNDLSQLRASAADAEIRRRNLDRLAEGGRLGAEQAEALVERLRRLPSLDRATSAADRAKRLAAAVEASVRVERELADLADMGSAVARLLAASAPGAAPGERIALEKQIGEQLAMKRSLLARIDQQQKGILQALQESESAEEDLFARTTALRNDALRLLLWAPLNPIRAKTFADFDDSLRWFLAPSSWRQTYDTFVKEAAAGPWQTALVVLVAVALYALRGRLKARLAALAPAAVSVEQYRILHTLRALLVTLLLALPGALLLWLVGTALESAPSASQFSRAIGHAFTFVGLTFLAMYGFSWLFDERGVAVKHFGWPTEAMVAIQRAIRRFLLAYVPLAFIAVANSQYAPHGNRESLGRIAFILAMIAASVLVWRLFRRDSTVTRTLMPEGSPTWAGRLRPIWMGLLTLFPLGLAALSGAGFYFAAIAIFELFKRTLLVVLAAVIVYGLIALWVLVQRARLARRQAAASDEAVAEPQSVAGGGAPPPRTQGLDIAAIGRQSRRLLNLLTTVILITGLWLIWRDALPVIDIFGELTLWRYTETIDGEQVSGTVTLETLALVAVILVVTWIATRNIGAVLDMFLLQRLELQKDATYAIKTVSRYAIFGIGLVLASNALHVSWDKLQWLVAALGVGLGFGLQEIVANFVSGLIVLGERPIRIGDVVTVGDVSGTVTRIRARATVITDWDNKEIMIPNKAFITERVVNWTLSSQTTRLLIKVGVSYGTDVEKAQRVMLDAVKAVPEVLAEPTPSVFFLGFGDSSLDFEIRAFVDAFDKRLRTQHAVNVAIVRALAEHGIEIPFPQRDLHIRSAEGLSGLVLKPAGPAAGA